MIYVDSSVALAQILAEDHRPPTALWEESLIASRLLAYEVCSRLHGRGLWETDGEAAQRLIGGVALLEMSPPVLERALEPFPSPVRTLDALHLASLAYLRENGQSVRLASYDRRMVKVARALGFPVFDLDPF